MDSLPAAPEPGESGTRTAVRLLAETHRLLTEAERQAAARIRRAEKRLRDAVWDMETSDDLGRVLAALDASLRDLGIDFLDCGVNVIDLGGQGPGQPGADAATHSLSQHQAARPADRSSGSGNVIRFWRSGGPVYRPDLLVDDPYDERAYLSRHPRGQVRAVVDVPFHCGTLAVNSERPHAFTATDIEALQGLAEVLDEAFRRRDDLRQAEARGQLLEAEIGERRAAEHALRTSEERHRMVLQTAIDGIVTMDTHGRICEANATYARMSGYTEDELIGMRIGDLDALEAREATDGRLARLLAEGHDHFESRHRRRDGGLYDVEVNVLVHAGDQRLLVAFVRDITERRRAEQERENTLELLKTMGQEGRLEQMTAAAAQVMLNWSGCQAVAVRLRDGDDYPYIETRGFPAPFAAAERQLCAMGDDGQPLRDEQGNVLLECMCGNVLCGRTDARLPFFTSGGSFWSNCTTQLLASTTETERQSHTRNRCNREGYESVALVPMRYGSETLGLLQFNDRRPDRFTAASISQLERLASTVAVGLRETRVAQSLRESQVRYALVFERSPALLSLSRRATGVLVEVNERFCATLGLPREQVLGRTAAELGLLGSELPREAVLGDRAPGDAGDSVELALPTPNGTPCRCVYERADLTLGGEDYVLSLGADVTEQRLAQEQVARERARATEVDRLHALGEMATSVAHELNQPLNGIRAFAEGVLLAPRIGWAPTADETQQICRDIVAQVDRMGRIIDHMRQFARPDNDEPAVLFDAAEAVTDAIQLVGAQLRDSGITVREQLETALPLCRGWPAGVAQAAANLLTNARDALLDRAQAPPETAAAPWAPWVTVSVNRGDDGQTLRLAFGDNGGGLTPEAVTRVFEPFYTTKQVGKGTGIGLTIVRRVAEQHGGRVELDNHPGHGLTVTMVLPTAAGEAD
jgi:PAS domain S-box-containing protein